MELRVRVQGLGFGVQGAGCRVEGAGCRVRGAGLTKLFGPEEVRLLVDEEVPRRVPVLVKDLGFYFT